MISGATSKVESSREEFPARSCRLDPCSLIARVPARGGGGGGESLTTVITVTVVVPSFYN
jgi:hypothetical protein